jgi:flavorubredoxin
MGKILKQLTLRTPAAQLKAVRLSGFSQSLIWRCDDLYNSKGVICVKILIVYFTQTGNTEKVAKGIFEELITLGHEVHIEKIKGITSDILENFNLVFIGAACHDTDLAQPVNQFLEGISHSPPYKMAGFVTHATYTDEDGNR